LNKQIQALQKPRGGVFESCLNHSLTMHRRLGDIVLFRIRHALFVSGCVWKSGFEIRLDKELFNEWMYISLAYHMALWNLLDCHLCHQSHVEPWIVSRQSLFFIFVVCVDCLCHLWILDMVGLCYGHVETEL
jgi:hypothetical protein